MATLVFLLVLLYEAASGLEVKPVVLPVKLGDNVTLLCEAAAGALIRAVEWSRDDLQPPQYVLFYRNGRSDPTHQSSSFEGRVQLPDSEVKTGNVSLILRNVSRDDEGQYECRVATGVSTRSKRAIIETEPIRVIKLKVTNSGSSDGNFVGGVSPRGYAGIVTSCVLVCFLVMSVFLFLFRYKKQMHKTSDSTAAFQAVVTQPV